MAVAERIFFDSQVAAARVEAPIFILGHWRSGTTLLHYLLGRDARFGFPNFYQSINPHHFLITEMLGARGWTSKHRLADNLPISPDSSQEDEFALAILSRCSPYLGFSFPNQNEYYERFLSFAAASPKEILRWKAALELFVKKLSIRHQGKPIVLKSPAHTARIKLILEVFPQARFIHIHRNPYVVFQSTLRLYDTIVWLWRMQKPDMELVPEQVLRQYSHLYDAFFEDVKSIPSGHICDVAFEDFEADPIGELEKIYQKLGLGDFAFVKPTLTEFLSRLGDYKKNQHPPIPEEVRRTIAHRWRRSFIEWGYPISNC
jgi:omega-hydroxy-beta-dihydromenaquinone-9 sulfotransferase